MIHNPTTAQLYTHALANGDGKLAHGGALVVDTGRFTGRSPQDKFVVDEEGSRDRIWWGTVNHPLSEQHFDGFTRRSPSTSPAVIRCMSSTISPALTLTIASGCGW